jgi:hypothetical protein
MADSQGASPVDVAEPIAVNINTTRLVSAMQELTFYDASTFAEIFGFINRQ